MRSGMPCNMATAATRQNVTLQVLMLKSRLGARMSMRHQHSERMSVACHEVRILAPTWFQALTFPASFLPSFLNYFPDCSLSIPCLQRILCHLHPLPAVSSQLPCQKASALGFKPSYRALQLAYLAMEAKPFGAKVPRPVL